MHFLQLDGLVSKEVKNNSIWLGVCLAKETEDPSRYTIALRYSRGRHSHDWLYYLSCIMNHGKFPPIPSCLTEMGKEFSLYIKCAAW